MGTNRTSYSDQIDNDDDHFEPTLRKFLELRYNWYLGVMCNYLELLKKFGSVSLDSHDFIDIILIIQND